MRQASVRREDWPIRGVFNISRGAKTVAETVVAEIVEDGATGRGECVPYRRYGETVEAILAAIEAALPAVQAGAGRADLAALGLKGAARNALDCALWDLEAKRSGKPVWQLAGLAPPQSLITCYTLSLDAPANMAEAAAAAVAAGRPLLKCKFGGAGDLDRLAAIRAAAPSARLVVDANEAWTPRMVADYGPVMAAARVEMIEQPLPAAEDEGLRGIARPVPICADESCHGVETLDRLVGLYDLINIKLDKAGGLTPALELARAAAARGFGLMVGCMVGTSLSMAPGFLVAQKARVVDLDGPLLLDRDRTPGIAYDGARMQPPPPALWG